MTGVSKLMKIFVACMEPQPICFRVDCLLHLLFGSILIKKFKMRFVTGFTGVQQDPDTLALSPQIGRATVDEDNVS